jgi:hypothetical protein
VIVNILWQHQTVTEHMDRTWQAVKKKKTNDHDLRTDTISSSPPPPPQHRHHDDKDDDNNNSIRIKNQMKLEDKHHCLS